MPVVYKEGDRVEGDFKGKGVWCPGVVTCDREVSQFNVHWGAGTGSWLLSARFAPFRSVSHK